MLDDLFYDEPAHHKIDSEGMSKDHTHYHDHGITKKNINEIPVKQPRLFKKKTFTKLNHIAQIIIIGYILTIIIGYILNKITPYEDENSVKNYSLIKLLIYTIIETILYAYVIYFLRIIILKIFIYINNKKCMPESYSIGITLGCTSVLLRLMENYINRVSELFNRINNLDISAIFKKKDNRNKTIILPKNKEIIGLYKKSIIPKNKKIPLGAPKGLLQKKNLFGEEYNKKNLFGEEYNNKNLFGEEYNKKNLFGEEYNNKNLFGEEYNNKNLFGEEEEIILPKNQISLPPINNKKIVNYLPLDIPDDVIEGPEIPEIDELLEDFGDYIEHEDL